MLLAMNCSRCSLILDNGEYDWHLHSSRYKTGDFPDPYPLPSPEELFTSCAEHAWQKLSYQKLYAMYAYVCNIHATCIWCLQLHAIYYIYVMNDEAVLSSRCVIKLILLLYRSFGPRWICLNLSSCRSFLAHTFPTWTGPRIDHLHRCA